MRTSTFLPVALIAACLAGCESGGVSYILPLAPRDFGAHTDQYDIKYEFIPDAQRVTEDCSRTGNSAAPRSSAAPTA